MDHEFMNRLAKLLNEIGLQVIRFEFPYMAQRRVTGKRALPNKMPVLLDCYKQVIQNVLSMPGGLDKPLFLAGKSLGGRVATMIADGSEAQEVFVIGYPFHPIKKPEKLRTEHLESIESSIVIFQGTRDALGSKEEVDSYALNSTVSINWLEDGDHDLKPRKRSGFSQEQHIASVVEKIAGYLN